MSKAWYRLLLESVEHHGMFTGRKETLQHWEHLGWHVSVAEHTQLEANSLMFCVKCYFKFKYRKKNKSRKSYN